MGGIKMKIIDSDALPLKTQFSDCGEYSFDYVSATDIKNATQIAILCGNCKYIRHDNIGHRYFCGNEFGLCGDIEHNDFCPRGRGK